MRIISFIVVIVSSMFSIARAETEAETASQIKSLVKSNVLVADQSGNLVVSPDVLQQLEEKGLLREEVSAVAGSCRGGDGIPDIVGN